jgi:hypothetical protein
VTEMVGGGEGAEGFFSSEVDSEEVGEGREDQVVDEAEELQSTVVAAAKEKEPDSSPRRP